MTKFAKNHSLTFGGTVEKFHSDNSFYFGIQSAYSYNTLADFYADANGFLANPNRTVSPVNLLGFQVKYLLQPGQTTPPLQPLDVMYAGGYVQDEWRPRANLTVTAGLRVDVPKFGNTAFDNPVADKLTFRDQDGSPVKYNTGALPATTAVLVAARRLQLGRDCATSRRRCAAERASSRASRRTSGFRTRSATPACCTDSSTRRNTTAFPFNPNPDKYKPAPTGGVAASYELDVTDQGFRFPQTWRTNIGVDRRLPWGLVGTLDYIYNRDLNAPVYINANLPAAEGAYTGVDNRPRWAATAPGAAPLPGITVALPACAATGQDGPCFDAPEQRPGQPGDSGLRDQEPEPEPVVEHLGRGHQEHDARLHRSRAASTTACRGASSSRRPRRAARGARRSRDRATIRTTRRWRTRRTRPASASSSWRSYTAQYFGWGATTFSVFYDGHTNGEQPATCSRVMRTATRSAATT